MFVEEKNLSLKDHLEDLRRVLAVSAVTVLVTTIISYAALGDLLFQLITDPLRQYAVKLIYIGMAEAFFTRIKISFLAGVILALPVILWEIWRFVSPALYPRERRRLLVMLPLSLLLFAAGVAFAYLVVFNFAARFLLVMVSSEDLTPMISIGRYVSFLVSFLIPFGVIFELPLVVYFLARMGLIDYRWLSQKRKYALLVIFTLAAVLTPGPDVISQVMLAGPTYLLYETGVLVARLVRPRPDVAGQGAVD